jgi:hypothetical protein
MILSFQEKELALLFHETSRRFKTEVPVRGPFLEDHMRIITSFMPFPENAAAFSGKGILNQ